MRSIICVGVRANVTVPYEGNAIQHHYRAARMLRRYADGRYSSFTMGFKSYRRQFRGIINSRRKCSGYRYGRRLYLLHR
jgi:hypothetical protein